MRVLVTGATGFVGRHAVTELRNSGHDVMAMLGPDQLPPPDSGIPSFRADLQDRNALDAGIRSFRPDACLHLAGIAFVPVGWSNPQLVFRVNVIGTVNLLEAFRAHAPEARILSITSSLVYGNHSRAYPLTEEEPPAPDNIYALSKWSQDEVSRLFARRYGMHIMTARPCNHIGPGQSEDFVVTSFARQLIDISEGRQNPVMRVGNLASERSFTDVRDTVRAYRMLIEGGRAGEAYNVASRNLFSIQSLFDTLCAITGVNPSIEIDPDRYRPTDSQPVIDCSTILEQLGWEAEIPIEQTLRDVIDDVRARRPVKHGQA